jgi:hypothetical protein
MAWCMELKCVHGCACAMSYVHVLELVSVRSTWRVLGWGALQSNDTSNNVSHYTQQRRHLPQDLDSFRSQLMFRHPKTETVDLTLTIKTPGITWTLWEMAREEVCHWPGHTLDGNNRVPRIVFKNFICQQKFENFHSQKYKITTRTLVGIKLHRCTWQYWSSTQVSCSIWVQKWLKLCGKISAIMVDAKYSGICRESCSMIQQPCKQTL